MPPRPSRNLDRALLAAGQELFPSRGCAGLTVREVADAAGVVGIRMTLTAPACPAAQTLPVDVKNRVAEVPGVTDVKVDVVWDPPWDRDRMSDAAKLQLGMF